jgi:hypothetical protein
VPDPNAGYERGHINNLVLQPVSAAQHEAALREVYKVLGERHHFNADDKEALEIWDTLEGAEMTDRIFGAMTLFFGVVAVRTPQGHRAPVPGGICNHHAAERQHRPGIRHRHLPVDAGTAAARLCSAPRGVCASGHRIRLHAGVDHNSCRQLPSATGTRP